MVKVTRNFQVTLPERVRVGLGVNIGDEVFFERENGTFALRKVEHMKLEDFIGILKFKKTERATELQRKWRAEFEERRKRQGA